MPRTASGLGVSTPTIGVGSYAMYNYVSTGAALCLDIGFIPQYVQFWSGTLMWTWNAAMTFGQVIEGSSVVASNSFTVGSAGILDTINGSGQATTNVSTTTRAVGLVLGTNVTANSGAGLTYTGFCLR